MKNAQPKRPGNEPALVFWIVPAALAVVLPSLWWTWADRPFPFRPQLMATMTLWVAIVALAMLAALSGGLRRRLRWALGVTAIAVTIGFQWQAFTYAGTKVTESTGLPILGDVVPVVIAGALLWLGIRLAGELPFALMVGGAILVVVVVLGATALSLGYADDESGLDGATAGPDVLLLVLDGYGRADWLASEFGFNNSPFLDQLEDLGFFVAEEATANYATTYASLSAMLNLSYIFDDGPFSAGEWDQMRSALTGRRGMIPAYQNEGYQTVLLENAWGGSQCSSRVDRCVRDGLVERSLWNLSQMTIVAPLIREVQPDPFNSVSFAHLDSLADTITAPRQPEQPLLTVAHVLLPHEPMLLNSDCTRERHNALRRWGSTPGEPLMIRRMNYANQAQCVNRLVVDTLTTVLEARPDTLVMITADHGPASTLDYDLTLDQLSEQTILERMQILSAYRLPGCTESLRQDLTPVNGARIVTNCALGTELGELPDHNFWAISLEDPIESVAHILDAER